MESPIGGAPRAAAARGPYPRAMATGTATARSTPVAAAIRDTRLIVVLRRVPPRARLLALVDELAAAGARIFEVTLDGADAAGDIAALREHLAAGPGGRAFVGAGTVRTTSQVRDAADAGAAFGVSPVFDRAVLDAATDAGLPFIPGAYSPTEIVTAWEAGAAFVKLFPASSLGPAHIRELRGPLPDVETIATGGVDSSNARDFLAAGAAAVGIGSAIVRASAAERRALISSIAEAGTAPPAARP